MENMKNEGYEIIVAVPLDARHAIAIGRNTTACAQYVCCDCTLDDDWEYQFRNGLYCSTYRQAMHCLSTRITAQYDSIPYTFPSFYEGHFTPPPMPLRKEAR